MGRFRFIASALLLLGVAWSLCSSPAYAADPFTGIDCSSASSSALCSDKGKKSDPLTGTNGIITKITRLMAAITGAAAVIMLMVGGFMYVTSSGDSGKLTTAKHVIIYALVGLFVIIFARTLILFVMSKL